jgi:hypothetical protein
MARPRKHIRHDMSEVRSRVLSTISAGTTA